MWANGKKVACCLSFDFDAESLWFETFQQNTPSPLSRGEYGARVGVPKVLRLLEKYNIPATFFVPGWVAEHYPEHCKEIVRRGHEIGYHGYYHESVTKMREDNERDLMRRGMEMLEKTTGYHPRGNRSVPFDLGPNTAKLLVEFGFTYDSSMMGADNPYYVRIGGQKTGVVELPVAWEMDDAPFFIFSYFPYMSGLWSPDHVYSIWKREFDGAYEEGGLFLVTTHPQIIGRRSRMQILEALIQYINQHEGVWWARHIDAAEDWLRQQAKAPAAAPTDPLGRVEALMMP